jgi:putative alpha-1,2-mannosidase
VSQSPNVSLSSLYLLMKYNSKRYSDRQEVCIVLNLVGLLIAEYSKIKNVDYEVRAGLSSVYNVAEKGWVADDIHSESASRTLDYACMSSLTSVLLFLTERQYHKTDDDYAAYVLALQLGKPQNITDFLYERAMRAPFSIYNNATGFMEARNVDGSWAGPDNGWTEGAYVI